MGNIPGTVYTLGDNAYPSGTRAQFANCYDNYYITGGGTYDSSRPAWWGQYKRRTMPTLGNHEYSAYPETARPYFDYFRAVNGFKDPSAPVPSPGLTLGKGYYSYDRGSWHIVALNSICNKVGGCGRRSPQGRWLRNDLADHPSRCTLAYFHHPLFSSREGTQTPEVRPFWRILYNHNADVILSGHAHSYERFAPQRPSGMRDPENGIREFVVGTGGEPPIHDSFDSNPANSQVRKLNTPGVLKLDLQRGTYHWRFVPIAGKTFTDSGKDQCH